MTPRVAKMKMVKATTSFIPSMKGKKYATGAKYNQLSVNQLGAVHLAYRGQRYLLKDGIVNVNLAGMPGVPEDWEPPTQYVDGVINLNTIDTKFAPKSDFDVDEHILGVIMAQQYSLRKGIELFGKRAEVAAVDELSQIHHMATYTPMDHTKLTPEQKRKALSALFFLTEKQDGKMKGRNVAVGSKQRSFDGYKKSDGASPTVSTNGLIITSAIDAHKGRDVAVMDILGAYLHALNDEFVLMCLRGKLAEMMVKVDPKLYRKYVTTSAKGEPILYVKLNKALYGLLKSALLWYKKLRGELEEMGFVVNDYDPCVANCTVEGSQLTVTWHVDDLKVSHANPNVVSKFILDMAKIYGPNITVSRGETHDYLGMDLDYSTKGAVKISMIKYLRKVFEDFPELIKSTRDSPAADHLFKVR